MIERIQCRIEVLRKSYAAQIRWHKWAGLVSEECSYEIESHYNAAKPDYVVIANSETIVSIVSEFGTLQYVMKWV